MTSIVECSLSIFYNEEPKIRGVMVSIQDMYLYQDIQDKININGICTRIQLTCLDLIQLVYPWQEIGVMIYLQIVTL